MDIYGNGEGKVDEEPNLFEMLENMQDRIFGIEESLKYIESVMHRLVKIIEVVERNNENYQKFQSRSDPS